MYWPFWSVVGSSVAMVPFVTGLVPVATTVRRLVPEAVGSALGSSPVSSGVMVRVHGGGTFSGSETVPVTGIGAVTVPPSEGEVIAVTGASVTEGSTMISLALAVPRCRRRRRPWRRD